MTAALLRNSKIARATHNILAYRFETQEGKGVVQDFDDDGETAAGGRLLHLLQVCIICSSICLCHALPQAAALDHCLVSKHALRIATDEEAS